MDKEPTEWMILVDTKSYAGNFERELTGFCTGAWDGETHGGLGRVTKQLIPLKLQEH